MANYWIAVASKEHVMRGVKGGFMQVCHGKAAPLRRMQKGDWILYYSPVDIFGSKEPCRSFTAIGSIKDDNVYQVCVSDVFKPWRRTVDFIEHASLSPIQPLIATLKFIKNKVHWGFVFRRGCFKVEQNDFMLIAKNMKVTINEKTDQY